MPIETSRLILRKIQDSDVQGMYALDSDPDVHHYLGRKPIHTIEEAQGVIDYIRRQYHDDGIGRWAMILKNEGKFVGWAGLKYEREVRHDMHYYDLGYRLLKKYWGQGFATEAARASLKYGFENMKLPVIYAGAHVDNSGSNKVLRKVGMSFVETFEFDGADHHWYRFRREEWVST